VRSTCSNVACSAARARGRRPAGVSPVRVSVLLALRRAACAGLFPAVGRGPRSPDGRGGRSCSRSGSPTAGGCSTASIRDASTSILRAVWVRRAAGTPSARSGCSNGGTQSPEAEPWRANGALAPRGRVEVTLRPDARCRERFEPPRQRRSEQAGGATTSEPDHFRDGHGGGFVTVTAQILDPGGSVRRGRRLDTGSGRGRSRSGCSVPDQDGAARRARRLRC
jgi:hypothetical protein